MPDRLTLRGAASDSMLTRAASTTGSVTLTPSWFMPLTIGEDRDTVLDRDRVALIYAVTDAIADDVADIQSFPVKASRIGTGEDVTETYRLARAVNYGGLQYSAHQLRRMYSDAMEYAGVFAAIDLGGGAITPLYYHKLRPIRALWTADNKLPDGTVAALAMWEVRNQFGQLIGRWDGLGNPMDMGAFGRLIVVVKGAPDDPYKASPRVRAAGVDADLLYYHRRATASVLMNDGMPSGVLQITDPDATEDQVRDLEARLRSRNQDILTKGTTLVTNYQTQFTPMGANTSAKGWGDSANLAEQSVMALFQMPESRLARGGARTYENQATELAQYYRANPVNSLQRLVDQLNRVAHTEGVHLSVGIEHPAMSESRDSSAARAVNLYQAGLLTKNEARQELGAGPVADGDKFNDAPAPSTLPMPDAASQARDARGRLPFAERADGGHVSARQYSDMFDTMVDGHEATMTQFAQDYHARLYRNVMGALARRAATVSTRDDQQEQPVQPIDIALVFDVAKRDKELMTDLPQVLRPVAQDVAKVVEARGATLPADMSPVWERVLHDRVRRLVEGVDPRTGRTVFAGWNRAIHDDLETALSDGYKAGEGMGAIAKRVQGVLGVDPANPSKPGYRATRIARTEVIGLANTAALETMKVSGVPMRKAWYSISDGRTREDHGTAADTYNELNAIPLTDPFMVGGYPMQCPGDGSAPASEIVNCRCRSLPVVAMPTMVE